MQNYNNIAFIPVRGGSKSIPLKNIRLINNRPLIYWVLDAAQSCDYIDKIFVSTDSQEIKDVVEKYKGSKVCVVDRSEETSTDFATTESAMIEFANKHLFNNIVLIQATSPLLTSDELTKGFTTYNKEDIDSVLSVVNQKRFVWKKENNQYKPQNYDFYNRPRRQDFEGFLVENGAFYITSRDRLLKYNSRISGNIDCVVMDEASYFEIDEINDWTIVESLLKTKKVPIENVSEIKIFLTDCDGVLTDGGMYYTDTGDEMKKFNTKDGMAFELLKKEGILTGIVTGENTEMIKMRAEKLKVDELYMGIKNKIEAIDNICKKYNIGYENIAYIGDDINDLEVIKLVGLGCCVEDAIEIIKSYSKYITKAKGGNGAVREVAELLISNK
ncbi:MAG: HAD-IIIA family hydrolase [Peptostreptococcaceae bacterium]